MADGKITVNVESVIHDALKAAVQKISEEFNVQVVEMSVDWIDLSTAGHPEHIVGSIGLRTGKVYAKDVTP